MDQRFPKALRLRRRREFLKVQEGGVKFTSGPLLVLARAAEAKTPTRLGITVSSKVGNAVVRVRIRRRVREHFRKTRGGWPQGLDVVVIARGSAANADSAQLNQALDVIAAQLSRRFP